MYLINCDLLIKNESEFFNEFYFFRFNYIILKIFYLERNVREILVINKNRTIFVSFGFYMLC